MSTNRILLLALFALVGAFALSGCGNGRQLAYARVHIGELERQVADLEAQLAAKDAELAALRAGGQRQAEPVGPITKDLPPSSGDFEVFGRDKDVVISISNEILFKPGSAVLSDRAKTTLNQVIGIINSKYKGDGVRVEGHTDDQQIKKSKAQWADNWDLSGGRAQAVLHYLLDHGIPAKTLGFAGYGMERPVASNSTNEGKSKNRRVEIVVITGSAGK